MAPGLLDTLVDEDGGQGEELAGGYIPLHASEAMAANSLGRARQAGDKEEDYL